MVEELLCNDATVATSGASKIVLIAMRLETLRRKKCEIKIILQKMKSGK